ncbi:Proline/betaine transporter [Carnimonas sp. R-84981]|uniref:MFS transporter n=1 Tax=Carnimonas bestiolae TaxID=3402172 RepID=UPI003EDB6CA1
MTANDASSAGRENTRVGRAKSIAAITIGNGLEFFDFTSYAFFAPIIGKLFFPSGDAMTQWLLAAASFAIGFITRPLGGLILGAYADRAGRKAAMSLTLLMMAVGSAVIACVPTYAQLGIGAPMLLIAARMLQGFALGGEVGASTTLLIEMGSNHSRGFYCSLQILSQGLNSICGALLGLALTSWLSTHALEAWGWRTPFIIGTVVGAIAIYIRRNLRETLTTTKSSHTSDLGKPIARLFTQHYRGLVIGILTAIGSSSATYIVFYYLSSYAVEVLHFPIALSLWAPVVSSAVMVLSAPLAGICADRYGRKPVMGISRILLIIGIYPAFVLINALPTIGVLIIVSSLLAMLVTFTSVSALVMQPELFPREVRVTGMSVVYCIGASIFGGFAPFFATLLIKISGNDFAPSWYLIGCGLISMVPLLFMKETAGKPLD